MEEMIRSEEQNEGCIAALYDLEQRHDQVDRGRGGASRPVDPANRKLRREAVSVAYGVAATGDCVPDGAARTEAEGPRRCIRHSQHRLRGYETASGS